MSTRSNRSPVIIAIFQTGWWRKDAGMPSLNQQYADPDLWRKLIEASPSGRNIKRVFKELFDQIEWRVANPSPPVDRNDKIDYDAIYIARLLNERCPDIVIAMGKSAQAGVGNYLCNKKAPFDFLTCCHPTEPNAIIDMAVCVGQLKELLDQY